MPTLEIDEEELRRLKTLEGTLAGIMKHPEAGKLVERAHRMVDEKAPTPRLDATKHVDERFETLQQQLAEERKLREADKQERENAQKLESLQRQHDRGFEKLRRDGWTDEGVDSVKKLMEEKGILDPMDAAAIYEKQHPPQTPVSSSGSGSWNFLAVPDDGDADIKALIVAKGENEPLLQKMAATALNEVRGSSRR